MNAAIAQQIQDEQDHGREKYGGDSRSFAKDDANTEMQWWDWIDDHNSRCLVSTPMERRQHLIKVAGLAVSAIEAFDRSLEKLNAPLCHADPAP